MRTRLGLSLFVTTLLIGGALWLRLSRASVVQVNNLTAIQSSGSNSEAAANAELAGQLANLNGSSDATSTASTTLSDTDNISHQLLTDYVNLALSGQVSDQSLNDLGMSYADSIASLSKAPTISSENLIREPDTPDDFKTYGSDMLRIYGKYETMLAGVIKNNQVTNPQDPKYPILMKNLSLIYQAEATELQTIGVPASLQSDHLKLTNIYLGDAWAYKTIADPKSDPTTSFSALVLIKNNSDQEQPTLADIEQILTNNGI